MEILPKILHFSVSQYWALFFMYFRRSHFKRWNSFWCSTTSTKW